jgi:hypothetical protein
MDKGDIALAGKGVHRWCQLTQGQKQTFITLRALAASPLMVGGDLPTMDEHSLSLLTNPEMLACNQNGVMGKCLLERGDVEIWQVLKRGQADTGWVGIFNRGEEVQRLTITTQVLGIDLDPALQVQDVWNERTFTLSRAQNREYEIEPHGVVFLAFKPRRIASQ